MSDIYTKGTRVWISDKDLGWISAEVQSVTRTDAKLKIVLQDERGKEHSIDTNDQDIKDAKDYLPPLRNPPLLEAVDDLATLSHLNEPSVLHTIRNRYAQHSIYTYSGIVLIAVNPFQRVALYGPEIIQAYSGRRKGELEPHLFAIAEDAYTRMTKDSEGQTIIVSGESGAGKTESAKLIMRFLASAVPEGQAPRSRTAKPSIEDSSEIEQQILATNPILEAFGNAKTTRNDNSSRFGKYLQILFDGKQNIVGARIRTYLLERSRLVYQPEIERNYHIFYQLCAGAPLKERKDLGLEVDVSKFAYLNGGGPHSTPIHGVDDAEEFRATQNALSTVGVGIDKQWSVFKLLAALLHLGNMKITAGRNDCNIDDNEPNMLTACKFLGLNPVEFKKWTIKKQITTRSEKIVSSLNAAQATVVRDSVSKFVYACLFEWLVAIVNESLSGENGEGALKAEKFIGVLDIYGFEHFKKNSFEQFCINYANEKLQQEFNAHVFKLEQEEYVREQINWTFIDFSDNQPCIDVIEGKLGVLALLDEESRLPAGTDQSFLTKLLNQLDTPKNKNVFKKPRFGNSAFTIAHYALDVTYEAEGFIEKNRDTVPDEQLALLAGTQNPFFKEVLDAALASTRPPESPMPGTPTYSDSGSNNSRRSSLIPDPGRSSLLQTGGSGATKRPGAVTKKPTLGSIFKGSLISLMETISVTNVHYIRCIKPNEAKRAWEFTPQQVLSQLRACGVLETIRISCAGYPTRWTYEEFAERYYMLVHSKNWNAQTAIKDLCRMILEVTIKDEDKYQGGLTKIFFRAGMLAYLEAQRSDKLNSLVTLVQKNVRRRLAVRRYKELKNATIKIQTWWRGVMARQFVQKVREEVAARRFQRAARRFIQRKVFLDVHRSVVGLQSIIRGQNVRKNFKDTRLDVAATRLQSLFRGILARRQYKSSLHSIVWMQSHMRRRNARKVLQALKVEARSAAKQKEISYQLENKVVQLTQNLQQRTAERKAAETKITELERQLTTWQTKHEDADSRARKLQADIQNLHVPTSKFEELLKSKAEVESRLEQASAKVAEQGAQITKLTAEVQAATLKLETQANEAASNAGDLGQIAALKQELSQMRDQLNRANALNSLSGGGRRMEPPVSPTFQSGLKEHTNASQNGSVLGAPVGKRHQRRHSSAGAFNDAGVRDSMDERMIASKRSQANNPRAVSVAYNGLDGLPRFRNGLEEIYDDPAEERIRLLSDLDRLDHEVYEGLITGLKIPSPTSTNAPSLKEVLFPANLIAMISNEMWKYGMIKESERFLANTMQAIQTHVMSFTGEDAIVPGVFWLSNVHEILSFVCCAENDILQGVGQIGHVPGFDWPAYENLIQMVKSDLDSLEYNIYHSWMVETKKKLSKMIIPALIETQSLPGFIISEGAGRLFNRLLNTNTTPAFNMDDVLNLLNKVLKSLKCFFMEESVIQQVVTELLKLVGVTSFNDLLMRRNFCSWKRAMQIQYNITRIEEWCKSHEMPEGTLQLEHLMQATKLLQLKKATQADIDIIYDVCWILTPSQIQRMCTNYFVADYENPISPEILKLVAQRVVPNDRTDHLLLTPENEDVAPYELPLPREISGLEHYVPAYLNVPHIRRVAAISP